jgi:hypothetical protein
LKTNITLSVDSSVLREAKILAAEEGTSISAMLAVRLEQMVRERKTYNRARKRAVARLRKGMNLHWTPHGLTSMRVQNHSMHISRRVTIPRLEKGPDWLFCLA